MASVWYCTREQVKAALDSKETARNNAQIDRLIAGSSRSIEDTQLHRRFYPEVDTRFFDWPKCAQDDGSSLDNGTRLVKLGRDELVSVTSVKVNGTTLAAADYKLLPVNDGPPFTHLELAATVSLTGDERRAVEIAGTFGYWAQEDPAGALAEALDTSETAVDVTNSALIGVGQILLVDSERMLVTEKSMLDTGVNIDASDSLTDQKNDVSITLSTTTNAPVVGETILIDSERMLVVDVAGTKLTVIRQWDGGVLAAHSANADIYAPRTLTVERGALGTTAATHTTSTAITKHRIHELANQLAIAETVVALLQETSGYGRVIGSGDAQREAAGKGLEDLRRRAYEAIGRKVF